jgi:hypothetical protein
MQKDVIEVLASNLLHYEAWCCLSLSAKIVCVHYEFLVLKNDPLEVDESEPFFVVKIHT